MAAEYTIDLCKKMIAYCYTGLECDLTPPEVRTALRTFFAQETIDEATRRYNKQFDTPTLD